MILKILKKWMKSDIDLSNFYIKENENNIRGLYCKKDIDVNKIIIQIYIKYILNLKKCIKNKIIKNN